MKPSWLTPRIAAFLIAGALAAAFADSVFRIPVQVSDSLDAIVVAKQAESSVTLFTDAANWSGTTLRPVRYIQARWLVTLADTAGISYNSAFRGTHAALVVALLLVFAWIARVERWVDVAALGFALTVFVGLHTFGGMTREAFPVNHFAETALSAMVVFGIAQRRPRWYGELLALVLLALCLFLIEAGVLVWVVMVTCALLRMPGLRPRTVAAATLVLAVYAAARYQLVIGAPSLGAHGSGYGAVFYSGDELRERFGQAPLPFMAYNVVGGALSVLLSEPRFGVYQTLVSAAREETSPVVVINIVSSLGVTMLLAWCAVGVLRRGWRQWSAHDHTVVAAVIVLGVSGALCANYMKDEILSVAGAFYALAAFVAARALLDRVSGRRITPFVVATLLFAVCAPLWGFRALGTHYELRRTAFITRNDWVLSSSVNEPAEDPVERDVTQRLRAEALARTTASPASLPAWGDRFWVE